ncbi:lipase secretion chaperone [Aquabacterium sp. CECT 9606]|uniref:lipase secretion chaperone n=1 Tax=Aquabacterium sp. CECT 9606 TaxID=2845822 RepID=UPI001E535CF3|nr:lipase secretion chaperone [Aquabacterium sp. CECT 9606]CAH0351598.1 Lipase chaperone [Aquabacterium sp. CECT 9606]
MQVRGMWATGLLAVVIGVGSVVLWQRSSNDTSASGQPGATPETKGWGFIGGAKEAPASGAAVAAQVRTPDQVRVRLFKEGSFAGTEPAGNWCVSEQKLKPCPELRSRFEYYVLGLGEVTIEEIRGLIQDEAKRANGDAMAAQIMAIWDKYWQVRTYAWRHKFVQADRSTWMPVFEEQRSVRRQILGQPWAEAFFKEDEQHFQEYYAQLESGQPPPPDPGEPVPQMAPGKDPAAVRAERVARYGEAAADRLDKADAEWADWERRLSAAKVEWERLQKATNLSDAQRKAEMSAYVKSNFPADEQLRVQALLHL